MAENSKIETEPVPVMTQWAHDIIHGVGGLQDYKKYELAVYNGCGKGNEHPDEGTSLCWAAYWTIECLTNPKYAEILKHVNERATARAQGE